MYVLSSWLDACNADGNVRKWFPVVGLGFSLHDLVTCHNPGLNAAKRLDRTGPCITSPVRCLLFCILVVLDTRVRDSVKLYDMERAQSTPYR